MSGTTHYRTFLIGNLTFGFEFDFLQICLFLNKESHKRFISNFNFILKKNKISADYHFLFKKIFFS